MSWTNGIDTMDAAFAGCIVLIVVSRIVARSALNLLDNESKVKLVDASARSIWFYLPFMVVIGLLFWRFTAGVMALFFYAIFALFYNSWWHYRNDMPLPFQTRIMVSNGIVMAAFLLLAIGFIIETT